MIFKEFENQPKELDIIEEQEILNTFKEMSGRYPDIVNMIDPKNRDKLGRLNDSYSK